MHWQATNSASLSDRASQTLSPVSANVHLSESSPEHSDNEEPEEHPMDVDFDVQLPPAFPNAYNNDDYGYNASDHDSESDTGMDLHDSNSSSSDSTPIIPSSPQHESRPHCQVAANNRFLTRVYHDKLNGESLAIVMHFCHYKFSTCYVLYSGQKCDQHGAYIAADSPPPPRESDNGTNDWTPYEG